MSKKETLKIMHIVDKINEELFAWMLSKCIGQESNHHGSNTNKSMNSSISADDLVDFSNSGRGNDCSW